MKSECIFGINTDMRLPHVGKTTWAIFMYSIGIGYEFKTYLYMSMAAVGLSGALSSFLCCSVVF